MDMEITFPGGKRVEASFKGHRIPTDQPPAAGGEGTAPTPFDLFLASIGACGGFYALTFCQTRSIPTEGMTLGMDIERDPERKRIARLTLRLGLPPGFPEKYRGAILKAVEACAVVRHLLDPPAVAVALA